MKTQSITTNEYKNSDIKLNPNCKLIIYFSVVKLIIEIYATSEFKKTKRINTLVGNIEKRSDIISDFTLEHAKDQINGSNNIRFHYALGYVLDYTNSKTFKGTNNGRRITPIELVIPPFLTAVKSRG